jgi:hypothetical protein
VAWTECNLYGRRRERTDANASAFPPTEFSMMLDMLRRTRMVAVVVFIVGGLWLFADWRANISDKAPDFFAKPTWDLQNFARGDDDNTRQPSVIDRIKQDLNQDLPHRGMMFPMRMQLG